jgi:hypothetical protein
MKISATTLIIYMISRCTVVTLVTIAIGITAVITATSHQDQHEDRCMYHHRLHNDEHCFHFHTCYWILSAHIETHTRMWTYSSHLL